MARATKEINKQAFLTGNGPANRKEWVWCLALASRKVDDFGRQLIVVATNLDGSKIYAEVSYAAAQAE